MADRFFEVYRLQPNLYVEGSPVIIEAGVLQKDTTTDRVLAQIKLRNLDEKTVIACKLALQAFEVNGTELGDVIDYTFLDLRVATGQDFGSRVPIFFQNKLTRRFSVLVFEIVFLDGSVWRPDSQRWEPLPDQDDISLLFSDAELQKQWRLETGQDCKYIPEIKNGLFRCSCGATNLASAKKCYKCGQNYETLTALQDENILRQKLNLRLEREAEELAAAEKAAEAARLAELAKRKKTKKILSFVIPIVIVLAIIGALTPGVIMPAVQKAMAYKKAEQLLVDGSYDTAKTAFEELGDYKDSVKMAKEAVYQKAASFYADGNYEEAISVWTEVNDYSDSSSRIENAKEAWQESDYQNAVALLNAGKYTEAMETFEASKGYKDSDQLYKKAAFKQGESLAEAQDYEAAIAYIEKARGYEGSEELYISTCYSYAKELLQDEKYGEALKYLEITDGYESTAGLRVSASYQYAEQLMKEADYQPAVDLYEFCADYKDASAKRVTAMQKYVYTHSVNTDPYTYEYLTELIEHDFSGMKMIYNELYKYKITVEAINTSKDSVSRSMLTISKKDSIYIHYIVSGAVGETKNVKLVYTLPDGTALSRDLGALKNGDKGSVFIDSDSWKSISIGANSNIIFRFYDDSGTILGSDYVGIQKG